VRVRIEEEEIAGVAQITDLYSALKRFRDPG
jgi:hypothetical protein